MWPTPMKWGSLFEAATKIGKRRYQIEYKRKVYEVICPEYINKDGDRAIVFPDFIGKRKKYPIHVYIFAIELYSSNPGMSQRAVAKATREKFDLPKFSHSTVCRTFKAMEVSIKEASEAAHCAPQGGDGEAPAALANSESDAPAPDKQIDRKRVFPSAADTAMRRAAMLAFIKSIAGDYETAGAAELSRKIVKYWYDKYKSLII